MFVLGKSFIRFHGCVCDKAFDVVIVTTDRLSDDSLTAIVVALMALWPLLALLGPFLWSYGDGCRFCAHDVCRLCALAAAGAFVR